MILLEREEEKNFLEKLREHGKCILTYKDKIL